MTTFKAHFDGKVLIPDEPVNLPVNCELKLHIQPIVAEQPTSQPSSENGSPIPGDENPLMKLIRELESLPDNPDAPTDGAAQYDHYLYGHPKRP